MDENGMFNEDHVIWLRAPKQEVIKWTVFVGLFLIFQQYTMCKYTSSAKGALHQF